MQTRQKTREGRQNRTCFPWLAKYEQDRDVNQSERKQTNTSSYCASVLTEESIASDVSLPFEARTWREVRKKLETIDWIQCDNPYCKKWRRVGKEEIRHITKSDKWYCKHNKDPNFSSCDVPEEDTEFYDRLADRAGLKYIKSEFTPGSLLWARMPGYCSWPALVTVDPYSDYGHLARDEEDVITHYHVEFLGNPHTHGWVSAKGVKTFTEESVNKYLYSFNQPDRRKGCRKRTLRAAEPTKLKRHYGRGLTVEDGVAEARKLLPCSPGKRLDKCIFMIGSSKMSAQQEGKDKGVNDENQHEAQQVSTHAIVEGNRCSPQTPYTAFSSTLVHRTKEERLMLDVEMYKRNERAFEHDVSRFMIRNGMKPCKGPLWQNQRISLFQLFLAVHERGGFEQVTQKRLWAAVYREVTDHPTGTAAASGLPKAFYQKYLHPYELFIRGKEYYVTKSEDQAERKGRKVTMKKEKRPVSEEEADVVVANTRVQSNRQELKTQEMEEEDEEEEIGSDVLESMLRSLEDNYFMSREVEEEKPENELDITFYDESTPEKRPQLTLADFEHQPAFVLPHMEQEDERNTTSTSLSGQELLHQLHVLQQDISFIQEEMAAASQDEFVSSPPHNLA